MKTKLEKRIRVRSWITEASACSQKLLPELQEFLQSLGGNSIFADLAISEAIRLLCRQSGQEAYISVRALAIGNDLRVEIRTNRGAFPAQAIKNRIQSFAEQARYRKISWMSLNERLLQQKSRVIRRILMPAESILMNVDGEKVTLYFRIPFTHRHSSDRIEDLAQKVHLEKNEVIY